MKETSERKWAMIFSINKSYRRVKRFFKDLSGNRWLVLHFVIAIALIAGTSSMLQQGQETADNRDIIGNTVTNYPLVGTPQVSKPADTICIKDILLSLLGQ